MDTYWGQYGEISKYNVHLNVVERLWATWYAYMQNDTIATGILSFAVHEVVYFGRSLPWMIIDQIPYFRRYKIQDVCPHEIESLQGALVADFAQQKLPTAQEQWKCAKLVLLSHFLVELPPIA